jgi:putative heme-binding domain-containing protein
MVCLLFILVSSCAASPKKETAFFNKKDLAGWKAANMRYWSVEDSAIVGRADVDVERNQFLWSEIKVEDFYLSVDVKQDSADRNAGIQFRSAKINHYGQAMGYQADIGLNYGHNVWGTIYYEDGRGLLHTSDPAQSPVKIGDWNHYEILASGDRIWVAINGKIVSALRDKGGDREGYIALQIHSGPAQTIRYRINELVHDPSIKLAGKNEEELNALLHAPLVPVPGNNSVTLKSGEIVGFAGGTNVANMINDGYLETLLTSYFNGESIKFRNIGWEGDQVYEQFRDVGFGDWMTNLDSLKINTVFLQFGQTEALEGEKKLNEFIDAYKKLLDTLRNKGKQIIILSPNAYEPELITVNDSAHWNNPLKNGSLQKYFSALQLMAQTEGYPFVDLYYTLADNRQLTYDGIHLNEEGQKAAAEITMKSLGIGKPYSKELDLLKKQIIAKNRIWFKYWRPGNWVFLRGDRTEQAFSRHWEDGTRRLFPEEMQRYGPLLEAEEKKIAAILKGDDFTVPVNAKDSIQRIPLDDNTIAEELASFNLDKDYNIELFASEGLGIAEPCAMRWDEKGRLWVLCIPAYPQPLPGEPANDKLIVLEDRDKDGRADASTVFADSLNIPLGFELGHNGVYLGEQTKLLFLKDTNNDLRCDSRQVLFSGFGTHDSHQTINSFTWSPGGELFFAHGLSIHSYIETAFGLKKAHRASIWRYRPVSHQLDNIVDENAASENPWGITFGDWGETFSKSNDVGVYFTSPALAVSEHKKHLPQIAATRIKSGIVEIPRSTHLPEDIRNDFLIAGYYNNKVERIKMKEDGAGYKGELMEPLLSSTGKNFRPVDIKTGPDGALYVLDWYNPIIGHYQASLRDPQRDKIHGRIWRITAKNRPLLQQPAFDKQSLVELFNVLASCEYWVRYQARRLIFSRPASDVLPALGDWVAGLSSSDESRLMAALTVYENYETVNEALLKRLLRARNAGARSYALQVAGRWSDRLNEPLKFIKPLVSDAYPRVRLMALVACSQVKKPESMNVAMGVLKYSMDKFIRYTFEKTVFALKDSWEPAFKEGIIKFQSNDQLAEVISVLTPEWYTAKMYRDLFNSGNYSADVKTKLLSALSSVGSVNDIEYILAQPGTRRNVLLLQEMGKKELSNITPASVNSLKKILVGADEEELLLAVIRLVRSWNVKELSPVVSNIVLSPGASDKIIAQGITTVVNLKDNNVRTLLDKFISHSSKQVRIACINGYAKQDVHRGASEILKEIAKGNGDVNDVRETFVAIIYEPGGLAALTKEINSRGLTSNLASAALMALDQKHISDSNLFATIKSFVKTAPNSVPKDYDEKYIGQLAANVNQGSAVNGEKLYNKLSCGTCHRIANKGGNIGPDLSAIGSGLSVDDIITEVLWPNKNIKEGYHSVRLDLKNGESVQGVKVLETSSTISVKASSTAPPVVYNKKDIAATTAIGSAMPAGLMSSLSEEEIRDVIKYLAEQRDR